ncbi:phosphoserine phosphatase SerB [Brachybacterium endophyticum]|uniref:phosphoserine phosphatase n=1 Tax=Brachybacterium endophyticum TaxID=2182385 RepID=A0A2U2RIJ0_9MICO|nr:phosphoserine phosphatase SerB [Brachybacterium endophyticum]PWH05702.1 phosphoserine phosphatase SerB [Brachybacterium endophyticum]
MTHPTPDAAPRALLVSDVDSTFLTQEVIELIADHAGTREQVEAVTTRAMRGELDFAESLRERVATLAGLDASVLSRVREALVPTPGALELFARAREAGVLTALVSGGFHEAIDELAARAGVDHVLANRLETADGRLTGRVEGPVVDAATKERTLRELAERHGIPRSRTLAVGDGANDALMVQAAGVGIAFRAKPALAEVADVRIQEPDLMEVWPHLERLLG